MGLSEGEMFVDDKGPFPPAASRHNGCFEPGHDDCAAHARAAAPFRGSR